MSSTACCLYSQPDTRLLAKRPLLGTPVRLFLTHIYILRSCLCAVVSLDRPSPPILPETGTSTRALYI